MRPSSSIASAVPPPRSSPRSRLRRDRQRLARALEGLNGYKQAVAFEVFGGRNPDLSTFGLSSQEAARVKREYIAFHLAYQDCRKRMLRGETDLHWPPGTWAMVQHFGQRASPVPTAA